MRWRTAALAVALLAVAAVGGTYVAGHRSAAPQSSDTATRTAAARPMPLASLDASAPTPEPARVARRLAAAVGDPAFGGVLDAVVVDAGTGRVVYAHRPDRATAPASTLKLLTAVAALETLGPNARLVTGVVRSGRTLTLVGGGDVTLARRATAHYPQPATLDRLARSTAAAVGSGRRYLLRYDAGRWTGPDAAPGWNSGYFTGGNVSRLSALEVDEGRQSRSPYVPRVDNPAAQAADAFAAALRRAGVRLDGSPRPGRARARALGVASVESPTVAALVQRMLTDSDNDLAEALGREVALRSGLPPTFAGAATAIRRAARRVGVPTGGMELRDASGLSRLDRVSPRTLAAVLQLTLGGHSELGPITAGLPVAGATGTLVDRYRRGAATRGAGVVHAKTGTLAGVNTLAGTLVDASGRLLVFAFMTDRAVGPTTTEGALDRLAARLAGCGCGGVTP